MDIKRFLNNNGHLMAILIPSEYEGKGVEFITDNDAYQQIATMNHIKKHIIQPHYHNKIKREVDLTSETLIIKKGVLKVELYDERRVIHSFCIKEGDILTLLTGAHGFEVVEDIIMVEVKQGPFLGDIDKTRF